MKLFAVSYVDLFHHDLMTEFVRAPDAVTAIKTHSKISLFEFKATDLEGIKKEAFNNDCMVNAVEVPQ